MLNTYLDMETCPARDPQLRDEIRASIRAPGTHKKPETIAAWMAENAEAEAERKYRETALDGTYGEVLCIGMAVDDGPVRTFIRRLDEPEANVLKDAFAWLAQLDERDAWAGLTWVGHNVQWDLRFLFQRCVVNGVRPTVPLRFDAKPNSSGSIVDTMTYWAGFGQRISLDRLCRALRIPSPKAEGIDGSQVFDLALAGRYDDIAAYCQRDVEAVREIHRRLDAVRY